MSRKPRPPTEILMAEQVVRRGQLRLKCRFEVWIGGSWAPDAWLRKGTYIGLRRKEAMWIVSDQESLLRLIRVMEDAADRVAERWGGADQ